jgi:hypothetical protein
LLITKKRSCNENLIREHKHLRSTGFPGIAGDTGVGGDPPARAAVVSGQGKTPIIAQGTRAAPLT